MGAAIVQMTTFRFGLVAAPIMERHSEFHEECYSCEKKSRTVAST